MFHTFYNITGKKRDGSDQELWNNYYSKYPFTELPTKYNVYTYDIVKKDKWWLALSPGPMARSQNTEHGLAAARTQPERGSWIALRHAIPLERAARLE